MNPGTPEGNSSPYKNRGRISGNRLPLKSSFVVDEHVFTAHLNFHLLHLENGDNDSVSLRGQRDGGNQSDGAQYLAPA